MKNPHYRCLAHDLHTLRTMRTRSKYMILIIFDAWIRQPGPRIDLIRTPTGTPIYFEALDRGSWVCQIEYQPIVNHQNSRK